MPKSTPYNYNKYVISHDLRRLIAARTTCQVADECILRPIERLNPAIFPMTGKVSKRVTTIRNKLIRLQRSNGDILQLIEDLYEES